MDIDTVAAELYGLLPDEFTTTRDARAKDARVDGNLELSAAIRQLRRPTTTAWLANLLVRERPTELNELLDLGKEMRQAQAALAGTEMRRLSHERRRLVTALSDSARQMAGKFGMAVSDASMEDLTLTLEAAFADADAAQALRSARLTAAMHHSGFGPVDSSVSVAATKVSKSSIRPETRRHTGSVGQSSPGLPTSKRMEAAERALRNAQVAVGKAQREADDWERQRQSLRKEQARRHQQVVELEERLRALRNSDKQATAELKSAEKKLASAERRLSSTRLRVVKDQAALDELRESPT